VLKLYKIRGIYMDTNDTSEELITTEKP
jgi:hypothetical protein